MTTVPENAKALEFAGAGAAQDGATERTSAPARSLARFLLLLALVWIALEACYEGLPMIRPGADIVLGAKFDTLATGALFAPADRFRIFVLGNSKTLAGFRPELFDAAFAGGMRSYNLGLPGDARILPILNAALEAGNIPTHVFLTIPWDGGPDKPTWLDRLRDDETILYTLIPFRDLPRDAITFVATSHFQFRQKYEDAADERKKMLAQRGWYFIKSQSFYPNDELPEIYDIPTDHPSEFLARAVPEVSYVRREIERLARQYHFEVVLIPGNVRYHAQAPAPQADAARNASLSGSGQVRIIGPDYWVYPAKDFSDPVHLNPNGAQDYTRDLAQLVTKTGILN
jgi:hypothetical protein